MQQKRVISFFDGFNLYHAIDRLRRSELKWLNLQKLSQVFLPSHSEILIRTLYFSAYSTHMSESIQKRQKEYFRALELVGVELILGYYKNKDRYCPECKHAWTGHEEKETDVNIALSLLDSAYQDHFDRALIFSNDSDLVPAIKMVRKRFPEKEITLVAPPNCKYSNELSRAASNKTKISLEHLERCLLPERLYDASRIITVLRPKEYAPTIKI